jgi:phosphate transport system substrate-binding protein
MTVVLLGLAAACFTMTAVVAQETKPAGKQSLDVIGSTTVAPIAEAFAAAFKKSNPDLEITVKNPGSGPGATALIEGRCQVATMSRFMKPEEFKAAVEKGIMPTAHAIAMDGVCPIVHPSNPLKNITIAQLKDIYTGKVTNWKALGGPDKEIVIISRDTASGTYESFVHFVMGKDKMFEKVEYVNANSNAHDRVAATEGAIAYVGLGFVDAKVKSLTVGGIAPSKKTIASGAFPLSRPLFFFTNGYPELGTPLHAFVTFYLTDKGQEIIESNGFIPVTSY